MNTSGFSNTGSNDYSQMRMALNQMKNEHGSDWNSAGSLNLIHAAWGMVADSLINHLTQSTTRATSEMSLVEKAIDQLTLQIETQNSEEDLSEIRMQCEEIIKLASPVLHRSIVSTEGKLKHLALACSKRKDIEKQKSKRKVNFPEGPVTKSQHYDIDEENKISKKSPKEKTKTTIASIEIPEDIFEREQRPIKAQVLTNLALLVKQLEAKNDA